jgi:TetR/AcrR family transcriptional regulator, transcriptional repressor for nem operon
VAQTPSRSNILEATRELMLKRGYAATSVDDICSKAGVSKGSFYHFFASKEELGLAVLNAYYQEGVARVTSGEFLRATEPYQRLLGFFDHLEAIGPDLWRHGCLMGNFATELAESSPLIQGRVAELFDELVKALAPFLRPVTRDRREAAELAEQTLMVVEGAIILARAHDDPGRIASGVRRFRRTVEARIAVPGAATEKATRRGPVRRQKATEESSHV